MNKHKFKKLSDTQLKRKYTDLWDDVNDGSDTDLELVELNQVEIELSRRHYNVPPMLSELEKVRKVAYRMNRARYIK